MKTPALTEQYLSTLKQMGLVEPSMTLAKTNQPSCRADFSQTIPKPIRDKGLNACLVIKNHLDRFKYMEMNVSNVAGALHIDVMPEISFTGYVRYDSSWYAVTTDMLYNRRIPHSAKIIPPELEHSA